LYDKDHFLGSGSNLFHSFDENFPGLRIRIILLKSRSDDPPAKSVAAVSLVFQCWNRKCP
jgi:hypothetical protein